METDIKFKNWILEFRVLARLGLIRVSIFCFHPLTLCLTLILLALTVGTLSGLSLIKWIFYAIILIFLGGIIIIFIYVTTLAGNEKFQIRFLKPYHVLLLTTSIIIYFYLPSRALFKKETFMAHLYYSNTSVILAFLTILLLSVLIIVIKLAENFKGALIKFV